MTWGDGYDAPLIAAHSGIYHDTDCAADFGEVLPADFAAVLWLIRGKHLKATEARDMARSLQMSEHNSCS